MSHLEQYRPPPPKMIESALRSTGELVWGLHLAKIADPVIVESLLQEVLWMIQGMDSASPEAAIMRSIIGWFSDQCGELVAAPQRPRLDQH